MIYYRECSCCEKLEHVTRIESKSTLQHLVITTTHYLCQNCLEQFELIKQ